jgi:hypothetical protein
LVKEIFGETNTQSVYVSHAIFTQILQTIMHANHVILVALLVMDLHMLIAQVAPMRIIEIKVVKHVYVNRDIINCQIVQCVQLVAIHVCIVLMTHIIHVNNVF